MHERMDSISNKHVVCDMLHVLRTFPNSFLLEAMANSYVISATTKTQNFKQSVRTPNYICLISKTHFNQPTTLFHAEVYPLQRSRTIFWEIVAESRSYGYIASGKNLKRPHTPKTQRNITKIVGHTWMGVINDKIIWLWDIGRLWRDRNWLLIDFDMLLRHTPTPKTQVLSNFSITRHGRPQKIVVGSLEHICTPLPTIFVRFLRPRADCLGLGLLSLVS